jgi:endonuclease G
MERPAVTGHSGSRRIIRLALAAIALVAAACSPPTDSVAATSAGPAAAPAQAASAGPGLKPGLRPLAGFDKCRQFFPGELPRVPETRMTLSRDLCYDAFAILHSGQSKTAVFVVQRLTREILEDAADEKRGNRFFADARLPSRERANLEDYKGSGLDRGHMAPAADMPTAQANDQSFSLANMVPQARINNQRTWADIEKATRHYVRRAKGPVFVFTGPVYGGGASRTVGPGKVWVPTHLYKLVYDASTGKSWAHWVENTDEARAGKPITYRELVERTGIEFLPGIAAAQ